MPNLSPTPPLTPAPTPPPTAMPEPPSPQSSLPGRVAKAPDGARGFDCNVALTAADAHAFAQAGFSFAGRYLSRTATPDLTVAEVRHILDAGLALIAVQHVERSPWVPDVALGVNYGSHAVGNARSAGLPIGVNLWLDLEGVAPHTPAADVSAYCSSWFTTVAAAGYVPGLYVGASCILNTSQIEALPFRYFWQSGSIVPPLPRRGYCMVQDRQPQTLGLVKYDLDTIHTDFLGNTPLWLAPR